MIKKIKYFIDYFRYLKNPVSCLLLKFGFRTTAKVKLKNSNETIEMNNVSLLNKLMQLLPYNDLYDLGELASFFNGLSSSKKVIPWGRANILNFMVETDMDGIPFFEYFLPGYYTAANIDYNNRCVIDVGSFVGDTAVLFASRGAEVYGFEPVKKNYDYSIQIKEINPKLQNKLHFFNLGVSDKPGKITIESMNSTDTFRDANDFYEVEIITIDKILDENKIKPDILKMDCEGCEFNIILNSDLSNFKDIIFEHHAGNTGKDYNLLINKLIDEGFKIEKIPIVGYEFEVVGLIHAYK